MKINKHVVYMELNMSKEKTIKKEPKENLDDIASVTVIDHILIRDKETGEVLVNKRG